MTMLKTLPAVDMTTVAAQAWTKLGETPFFPGGNALLGFNVAIGGAGVITLQGAQDSTGTGVYTIRTINAAQSAPLMIEITDLPPYIRTSVTTAGTGTITPTLEGVQ